MVDILLCPIHLGHEAKRQNVSLSGQKIDRTSSSGSTSSGSSPPSRKRARADKPAELLLNLDLELMPKDAFDITWVQFVLVVHTHRRKKFSICFVFCRMRSLPLRGVKYALCASNQAEC